MPGVGLGTRVRALLEMGRPLNAAMTSFAVIASIALATRGSFVGLETMQLLAIYVAGFAAVAFVMIINDVVDIDIDRVNAPWRPLPSGRLSIEDAVRGALLIGFAGLAAALLAGYLTAAAYITVISLGVLYNVWGKKTGLPGNVMVAGLTSSPFLYAGVLTGTIDVRLMVITFMVFTSVLAREIVKGIADVEGDRLGGVKTVAVTQGVKAASRLAALLYISSIVASPLPVIIDPSGVNVPIYLVVIGFLDTIMLWEAIKLWRGITPEEALRHKRRVLLYMLAALLGFFVASITA